MRRQSATSSAAPRLSSSWVTHIISGERVCMAASAFCANGSASCASEAVMAATVGAAKWRSISARCVCSTASPASARNGAAKAAMASRSCAPGVASIKAASAAICAAGTKWSARFTYNASAAPMVRPVRPR